MANDISLANASSQYLSGSIKWTGLGSGTDFGSVVDQLVELERLQINRLETWKTEWEEKITSIQGLNSRMASIKSYTQGFNTADEFYARSSTTSNSTIANVINTNSAPPGSHEVIVGGGENQENQIPAIMASKSFKEGEPIGGTSPLVIQVGDQYAITVNYDPLTDDIDAIAALIDAADTNDLLQDTQVVEDKVRGSETYKRLIITAENGGTANRITITDDSGLSLSSGSVDEVFEKTWLVSSSSPTLGPSASYTGSTNKTFTFRVSQSGTLGSDSIQIEWADTENNGGTIEIDSTWTEDTEYDVFQGIKVKFSAGTLFRNESFTIDAYHPVLQAARDSGLAQTEQVVHDGYVDLITPVTATAGEFVYRYEGVETVVNVNSNTSLEGLAQAINDDPNNRGVQASIINDGQNTSTSYHLVLTGKHTGAEHTIEVVSDTLDNFEAAGTFSTARPAANSMVKINGFPSEESEYLQRSTNTISDVLPGVIVELQGVGKATITVTDDKDQIKENINLLVNSVNFLLDYIREETKYDSETGESGVMLGNYTYSIVSRLTSEILYEPVPGLVAGTDTYTHLSQIGIKTDPDLNGQWVIDTTTLDNALKNDPEAVARLFIRDDSHDPDGDGTGSQGVSDRLLEKMTDLVDSEKGIGYVLIDNYNGIIDDIDQKIAREEKRVALVEERLTEKFARLETLLGELESQSDYLESQLEKLPQIGSS